MAPIKESRMPRELAISASHLPLDRQAQRYSSIALRQTRSAIRPSPAMEQLDNDTLAKIIGLLDPTQSPSYDFTDVEKLVPLDALRFAAVSKRCRQLSMTDAVWEIPYIRLSSSFCLDDQIFSMEENA